MNLTLQDCKARAALTEITIENIRIATAYAESTREIYSGFDLDKGTTIGKLEIAMQYGQLEFSSNVSVHQSMLKLGGQVKVIAPAKFLQNLRLDTLP